MADQFNVLDFGLVPASLNIGPVSAVAGSYETVDRALCTSTRQFTAGHVALGRVWLPAGFVVTNIDVWVQNAATAPTNVYAALYAYSATGGTGSRLAVSSDLASSLGTSTGKFSCPVSYTVPTTGFYWAAWLCGGGTPPQLAVQNTTIASVMYFDNPPFAAKDATGSRTAMPDPVTPGSGLGGLSLPWMRVR